MLSISNNSIWGPAFQPEEKGDQKEEDLCNEIQISVENRFRRERDGLKWKTRPAGPHTGLMLANFTSIKKTTMQYYSGTTRPKELLAQSGEVIRRTGEVIPLRLIFYRSSKQAPRRSAVCCSNDVLPIRKVFWRPIRVLSVRVKRGLILKNRLSVCNSR